MQLGPYQLSRADGLVPLLLAPMAPASEMPFRILCREQGASMAPTELISCEGLARRQAKTVEMLHFDPSRERPFYVQLFGGDPDRMALAAQVAKELGAELIDVNMGCPVPKVTRSGSGAALMADTARAAAIVRKICDATGLPVTAKIRSGWDPNSVNAVPFSLALEQAGVCAIAVHARTRSQQYSGRADWSVIAAVRRAVKIPVIGNGDVASGADALRMVEETGCDAVMIGRAALGNPWIFRTIAGGEPPTREERCKMILRHLEGHLALMHDVAAGVRSFRQSLLYYAHGLKGAAHFRVFATQLETPLQVREAIEQYFGKAEPDRAKEP